MTYIHRYFLSALAIGSLSFGFADDAEETSSASSRVLITPSAAPIVNHGFDIFLFGDFIYWTARVDGVQPNFSTNVVNKFGESSDDYDHTQQSHFHLKPGFKAGIGINFDHDGWDSLARYTWFRTHADTAIQGRNLATFKNATNVSLEAGYEVGSINWKLHFNAVDWELGRNYYISPKLLLRPFFGLKGSWLTQHLVNYISSLEKDTQQTGETTQTFSSQTTEKLTFWGLGIRPGLQTSWQFNNQWSIFGDIAFSGLWGRFKNEEVEHYIFVDSNTPANNQDFDLQYFQSSFYTITPVLEFALGLRWDYKFSDDDYRVRLQAGWEEQIWFNQNQFFFSNVGRPVPGSNWGNLIMQGLTVEFRFDF